MTKETRANLLLILTAMIWGLSFVALVVGMKDMGPFVYNGICFSLGGTALIIVILLTKRKIENDFSKVLKSGIVCGLFLFLASSFQKLGVSGSTAGKIAFITSTYMIIVPIITFIKYKKTNNRIWISIFLALIGLYLLCIDDKFVLSRGDSFLFVSAFFFACHVLAVDKHSKGNDPLILSSIQFYVCGILSLAVSFFAKENIDLTSIYNALIPVLYGGFMSVGIAFTLQVIAQKDAKPETAGVLMSLESVFASIGGLIILGEKMHQKGYLGCLLIFAGVIILQIKKGDKKNEKRIIRKN